MLLSRILFSHFTDSNEDSISVTIYRCNQYPFQPEGDIQSEEGESETENRQNNVITHHEIED